jgi:hypothetical protein
MARSKPNGQPKTRTLPTGAKQYEINWEEVTTIKDLKGVLQTFGLVFTCPPANIDHIKHLVTEIKDENQ